ncbi:DUF4097 family beta strand repeat-containing protein [Microbispora sp. NBC_01389]|uniref:DUF4097 family beta strand repeat-containing protein n=1 Tax=Microbispora sp. NBC_01389 TaxID=2903584 RepID=UPI0032440836
MSVQTSGSPPNRTWLVGGVLATVVALGISGTAVWRWAARPGAKTEDQAQTYQRPVSWVELDLDAGHIEVSAGEPGEVSVRRTLHWRSGKPTIREEWHGDTLRLLAQCPEDQHDCAADYTVRVPAGVPVQADTDAGDLTVRDLTGEVRLHTGAGEVTIDNTAGKLWVRSADGDITANGLRGDTDVETASGHLDLRYVAVPGNVRGNTGAGNIWITVPHGTGSAAQDGYRVAAETRDGKREVTVREDSASPQVITATTASGNITVRYA